MNIIRALSIAVAIALSSIAVPAHAGFSNLMSDTFGSFVNVTDPNAFGTSRRGVLTGGSVYIRNRYRDPILINFQPPSIKASCSGISFFGGSFSAINIDEFNEYVRAVMSNALGYLFQIGLEAICPTCTTVMRDIKSFADKVNSGLKNSCEMGKLIAQKSGAEDAVTKGASAFAEMFNLNETPPINIGDSQIKQDTTGKATEQQIAEADADKGRLLEQNFVLDVLVKSNFADKFIPGANSTLKAEFYAQIISLTGSIIAKRPAGEPTGPIGYTYAPPILEFKDLLLGPDANGNKPQIYSWNSSSDPKGLDMLPSAMPNNFVPMKTRVSSIVLGEPSPLSLGYETSVGILQKFLNPGVGAQPFNNAEIGLQNVTRFPIMAYIRDLASDPSAATDIAKKSINIVSIEILADLVQTVILRLEQEANRRAKELPVTEVQYLGETISKVRVDINYQIDKLGAEPKTVAAMVTIFESIKASLKGRTTTTQSPLSAGADGTGS